GIRAIHVTGVQTCALPISQQLGFFEKQGGLKKIGGIVMRQRPDASYMFFFKLPVQTRHGALPVFESTPRKLRHFNTLKNLVGKRSEERRVGKERRSTQHEC